MISLYSNGHFLANKDDAFDALKVFYKKIKNENGYSIACIRSDHVGELECFYNEHDIEYQFSSPMTPQQNRVLEKE